MSDRIWQFKGKLQENDKRVITEAEGTISEINVGDTPNLDIKSNDGKLIIDLKIPTRLAADRLGGVGKQFTVDDSSINAVGFKYGEIFNDYENNTAKGIYSHVTGVMNKAGYPYQAVFGKYNNNKENNLFEVGYGDDEYNRINIFEINKQGVATIATDIGNSDGISLKSLQKNKLEAAEFDYLVGESQAKIHTYTNEETITIGTAEDFIISIEFLTTDATTPMFFASVPFVLSQDAVVTFTYYLDENILSDDTLEQNFTAGKHFATLFNTLEIKENFAGRLKVKMKVSAGTATITEYKLRSALYVQGVGITAAWNGKINVTQNYPITALKKSVNILPYTDNVKVTQYIPIPGDVQQKIGFFNIKRKMNILGFTDIPVFDEVILSWVFSVAKYLDYIYNADFIAIDDNGNFKLRQEYADNYQGYSLGVEYGDASFIDINIDDFTNITNIKINVEMESFSPPWGARLYFSVDNKDNYIYNRNIIDDSKFQLRDSYTEKDYIQNQLNIKNGCGAIVELPLSVYKQVQEVKIKHLAEKFIAPEKGTLVYASSDKYKTKYTDVLYANNSNLKIDNYDYTMSYKGKLCTISGRTFNKVNDGFALIGVFYKSSGYTGPILVSTNPEAVTYYTEGKTFTYVNTIEYLGLTWYISPPSYFMSGKPMPSGGPAKYFEGTYIDEKAAALALFEVAGVQNNDIFNLKLKTTYNINDYNVTNSKLNTGTMYAIDMPLADYKEIYSINVS